MPKKKVTTAAPKLSKVAFVQQQPITMSAAEVVKLAKEAGLKIKPPYVYVIRSKMKQNGSAKKTNGHKTSKTSKMGKSVKIKRRRRHIWPAEVAVDLSELRVEGLLPQEPSEKNDLALRRLCVEVGLTRAEEIVKRMRATLNAQA